jgi:hypothetical protein
MLFFFKLFLNFCFIFNTVGFRIWCFFTKFHALNLDKEQIAVRENGHAMGKSHGHIVTYRVLVLILYKEYPPKLYKNEFATESDKWCFNGWL